MNEHPKLLKLSESDFRVKDDSHDVRGWPVLDHAGRSLGTVTDLLFEPDTEEVIYAAVSIAGQEQLLPIASLVFDEGAKHLLVSRFLPDTTFAAAEPTRAELAERGKLDLGLPPGDELPDMAHGTDYDVSA